MTLENPLTVAHQMNIQIRHQEHFTVDSSEDVMYQLVRDSSLFHAADHLLEIRRWRSVGLLKQEVVAEMLRDENGMLE